jgi:hypothetical protein
MERASFPGELKARSFCCLTIEVPCVKGEGRDAFTDGRLVLCESPEARHPQEKCALKCVFIRQFSALIYFLAY